MVEFTFLYAAQNFRMGHLDLFYNITKYMYHQNIQQVFKVTNSSEKKNFVSTSRRWPI